MLKDYNYNSFAKYYDIFEHDKTETEKMNYFLLKVIKKYPSIKNIVDLTCGTGLQVFYLYENGYKSIVGSDISKEMINIAKKKSKQKKVSIPFFVKDMVSASFNKKFDCVITMFNSIGNIEKKDFDKLLKNINKITTSEAYYIFDITNKDYWTKYCQPYEFIDTALTINDHRYVRFSNYKIIKNDILRDTQRIYIQKEFLKPLIINKTWDTQMYSYNDINDSLRKNGFEIVEIYGDFEFSKFNRKSSGSIVIVSKKSFK